MTQQQHFLDRIAYKLRLLVQLNYQLSREDETVDKRLQEWPQEGEAGIKQIEEGLFVLRGIVHEIVLAAAMRRESADSRPVFADRLTDIATLLMPENRTLLQSVSVEFIAEFLINVDEAALQKAASGGVPEARRRALIKALTKAVEAEIAEPTAGVDIEPAGPED